jgi:hypothetical protein
MRTRKDSSSPQYPLILLKQRLARRARNLLDPNWTGPNGGAGDFAKGLLKDKHYPQWHALMTTAAYVAQFQGINHHTRPSSTLTFTHRDGLAPMLDASYPEVTEETLP